MLIDRGTLERWPNKDAHTLHNLFSLAQQYRSSCTSLKILPPEMRQPEPRWINSEKCRRTSTRRSHFAPIVRRLTLHYERKQTDYQSLKQAGYLKGLLKVRERSDLGQSVRALCDSLIILAQRRVLAEVSRLPFNQFSIQLAQQKTAAGTTFLRWRNLDRSRMGGALWEELLNSSA